MISGDFITVTPIRIYALARGVRIVTLSAMPLVNRIWIMKNRKWRPGTRSKRDGKEKNRCGGMNIKTKKKGDCMATQESEMIDAFLMALEQMQRNMGLVVISK